MDRQTLPPRQIVYLVLAAAGLVLPWYQNLAFMRETGGIFDLGAFIAGVNANHAAASIGWDLTVACAAFLTWVVSESRRIGMRRPWIYFVLTFGIAFAFAAPVYLFVRDRHLAAAKRAEPPG